MELPERESLLLALRQRRNQILLGLFALVLLARIALPCVLRAVIVAQADEALVGRIALADLDLSLIRGGVALYGLEAHVAEQKLDPEALAVLAATRAAAVQGRLTRDHGIAEARLPIGKPAIEPPAMQPGVAIALGAVTKSAR